MIATLDPVRDILDRLQGVKPVGDGKYTALCPAHPDRNPSLSIGTGDDGRALLHCHAGCTTKAIVEAAGFNVSDLFAPNRNGKVTRAKIITANDTLDAAVAGVLQGSRMRAAYENGRWFYTDDFAVVRFDFNALRTTSRGKEFRPFHRTDRGWVAKDPTGKLPLYRAGELSADDPVYVLEGEKCTATARQIGLSATCASHGSKAAKKTDWSPLRGRDVRIIPDHDGPGTKFAADVAAILGALDCTVRIVELPDLADGEDIEQWLERVPECADAAGLIDELADNIEARPDPESSLDIVTVDAVPREAVTWLWKDRIAVGKLSLLVGFPDVGKSFVSLDIASRVSRGCSWADSRDVPNPAGDVLLMNCEDAVGDTVRPRLENCGADLKRIRVIRGTRLPGSPDCTTMFSLDRDLSHLDRALQRSPGTRLLIIDPIGAYLGERADAHKNADVRRVLAPLADLAARRHVAVLGIAHLHKSTATTNVLHRITGSTAFGEAARAAWICGIDPADPLSARRYFLQAKNNLSPNPGGLAYTIEAPGVVMWQTDRVEMTADELIRPVTPSTQTARGDARQWLLDTLANGAMESKELFEQATQAGHAIPTLKRAKRELKNVRARKRTIDGETRWAWMIVSSDETQGDH